MFDGIDPTVRPYFVGALAWPAFRERLQPHLAKMAEGGGGRYLASDLEDEIVAGNLLLWVAMRGPDVAVVMLTQIINYPRAKAMRCVAVVGHNPMRWMHLLQHVEEASRLNFNCTIMEALHNPRHATLLKRSPGWQEFHTLSEKRL